MIISIIILLLKQLDQILESRSSMCKQRVARPLTAGAACGNLALFLRGTTAVNKEDDDSPHTPSCLHLQQQQQQISSLSSRMSASLGRLERA